MQEQLLLHLEINCVLNECQSGFRPKHSCESAFNQWKKEIEQGNKIIVVFLDLKRAFETVDRKILVKKLENYGITGVVLKWFKSYLSDRKQYTVFKGEKSAEMRNDIEIMQRTPLSCLLFIIYINDIVKVLKKCNINLFCDDGLIWIAGKELRAMKSVINLELTCIYKCLNMNLLSLNVPKTKCMIIGGDTMGSGDIVINGEIIEKVELMKYLGVMVDSRLLFKENIEYLIKKMNKKTNWLRRMRHSLDKSTKLMVYKSVIFTHIDYCSSILYLARIEDIRSLQKIQNRALRSILNADRRSHIIEMLSSLKLLSVNQKIHFNVFLLLYKAMCGMLPKYMSKNLVSVQDVQPYMLRSNGQFRLPSYVKANTQNSLYFKGLKLLNEFMSRNTLSNNFESDKKKIMEFVKSFVAYR